ncbi:hypothetical protein GCM10022198_16000 [Klugiella xanthotipulae]|uniref:GDSL-like lipase/acylhydrolase family protein n=1 Tax=Klugiella xanthotipulae TaxID=244735 RepID=A0A543HH34_9MICO|nr:SGNH/GDSL hydrolase family protein [Klugiella xanthotipulae]TQM57638.1 GDSL-like lipase/acylhydrolase family protein [Klugiella xanthotipulae]
MKKRYALSSGLLLAVLLLGGAPAARAVDSADPTDSTAPPSYVVMGDSYTSGFGLPPYARNTYSPLGVTNNCQRSFSSYPARVAAQRGYRVTNVSCQGAVTTDFFLSPARRPRWGEPPQLDALGADTALITFTLGTNDAGFGPVLTECIARPDFLLPSRTCSGDPRVTARVDAAIAALDGRGVSGDVRSLDSVLAEIRARAPRAQVVGVGYPALYPEGGSDSGILVQGQRCEGVKRADQRWMFEKTTELNAVIRSAMLRNGYLYADPEPYFSGHALCDAGPSYFFGLVSTGLFHPNQAGQNVLADMVLDTLAAAPSSALSGIAGSVDVGISEALGDPGAGVPARPDAALTVTRAGDTLTLDAPGVRGEESSVAEWYVEGATVDRVAVGDHVELDIGSDESVSVTLVATGGNGLTSFATATATAMAGDGEKSDAASGGSSATPQSGRGALPTVTAPGETVAEHPGVMVDIPEGEVSDASLSASGVVTRSRAMPAEETGETDERNGGLMTMLAVALVTVAAGWRR